MLLKRLDHVDLNVGAYIHTTLHSGEWLARRVDSVHFVDADSVRRQVTFDVDTRWLADRQPEGLVRPGLVVVPLTLLTKQLLVDADLRDGQGAALHVARRPIDSYLAWTSLAHTANQAGFDLAGRPRVAEYVRRIVTSFPTAAARDVRLHQPAWDLPLREAWENADNEH